jgi:hypothetical protein
MSYTPWKELERRHAKRMGGTRLWRPDFSESKPDGETSADTWDAKVRVAFEIHKMFCECEKKYRKFTGDRRFHLVMFSRRHPKVGDLVVLRADDYAALVEASKTPFDDPLSPPTV